MSRILRKRLFSWVLAGIFVTLSPFAFSQGRSSEASSAPPGQQLPFRASLGASFKVIRDVPDLRYARDIIKDVFGDRRPVPEERYSLFSQNFHLEFLLNNSDSYSSALKVDLGFRNRLGAESAGPEGSEFYGYRIALRQNLAEGHLQSTLQYGHRRSDVFRLHARHSEFMTELFYVPVPEAIDPEKFPFYLKVGADLLYALTTTPDKDDSYDPMWGLVIFLRHHLRISDAVPIALSLDAQFHRILGYKLNSTDEPAAGLVSVSPQIDLMLVENLWLGFQWNLAVLRPEGREEAFPNADLNGLYGSSFAVHLKTSTF